MEFKYGNLVFLLSCCVFLYVLLRKCRKNVSVMLFMIVVLKVIIIFCSLVGLIIGFLEVFVFDKICMFCIFIFLFIFFLNLFINVFVMLVVFVGL